MISPAVPVELLGSGAAARIAAAATERTINKAQALFMGPAPLTGFAGKYIKALNQGEEIAIVHCSIVICHLWKETSFSLPQMTNDN
jgi:hypothetical protein